MEKKVIIPPKLHKTVGYSPAIRVGNTIYVSGQVGLDAQGKIVGQGHVEAQAIQTMENLKTILEVEGAGLQNVVKLTAYLTRAEDYPTYRDIRARYFPEPWPASTTVIVSALASPEFLLEVEAVAVVD